MLTGLTTLFLLLSPVVAVPGSYSDCKPGRCLNSLKSANARQQCEAFLAKTVIPCPTTLTRTATVTATKPKTTTISRQVLVNPTTTITSLVTSVATITDVATVLVPTEIDIITTVVVPVTVTEAIPPGFQPAKRVAIRNSCKAKTTSASALPDCASACSGKEQFASACSCLGAVPKTITAKQATAFATVTKTVTNAPVVTVTKVRTSTSAVTEIKTVVVPQTKKATITTSVASEFTKITTALATSTVTVPHPPPKCPYFKLYSLAGYLKTEDGGILAGPPENEATVFEWRSTGLYISGTDDQVYANDGADNMPLLVQASSDSDTVTPVTCTYGANGLDQTISCQSQGGRSFWRVCLGSLRLDNSLDEKFLCGILPLITLQPACN